MRNAAVVRFALIAVIAALPELAFAQATTGSIAGIVRDTTGAVLPGVTVEAASPALIEKSRVAASDAQGNYKIVDLRPGTYTVTFTLVGFSTIKRDGIELTTGFTANVNADLKVGAVEETVTVSGASPIVDVQNVRQQLVLTKELWEELPTGKSLQSYISLTLGASYTAATSQDVGGSLGERAGFGSFTVHGASANDSQIFIDGMNFQHSTDPGLRIIHPNQLAYSETTVGGGISAEIENAGVQINLVPKDGGNRFTGVFAWNGSSGGLQGNNLTQDVIARGIKTAPVLEKLYDVGFGVGGPIKKDKLWFHESSRWWDAENTVPGAYWNATPTPVYGIIPIYTPDLSRPAIASTPHHDDDLRLTWQAAAKHKISSFVELYEVCQCMASGASGPSSSKAPEASLRQTNPYGSHKTIQVTWNYPASNRLLFEARNGLYYVNGKNGLDRTEGVSTTAVPMRDLTTGFLWNALGDDNQVPLCCPYTSTELKSARAYNDLQGSMSLVSGSHAFKAGVRMFESYVRDGRVRYNQTPYGAVRFDVRGGTNGVVPVPASIYELVNPRGPVDDTPEHNGAQFGLASTVYAQDQWTLRRLTLNLGVRYDGFHGHINPLVTVPNDFVGSQTFPAVDDSPSWKDVSPRVGGVYDLFGTGRTAIKASVGRYLTPSVSVLNNAANQIGVDGTGGARTWNDANGNFVPDCDLKNPQANGECGRLANVNRGLATAPSQFYDPNYLVGFGVRKYLWQTSASLQQELRPGVGLNVSYFRTSYSNFIVTDNRAVTPADYSPFCVTAPIDGGLGSVSGQQLCGLYDVNPAVFGQVNNFVTAAAPYGRISDIFNGVDMSLSARFGKGAVFQGGVSTGQEVVNNCVIVDSPQAARPGYCQTTNPWSNGTQIKLFGAYPLPWWQLQVSGTFQNLPGPTYNADRSYTSAQIAPSLGRSLASGATGTATVPLVPAFTLFEDRFSQLDLRLTKIITIAKLRTQLQADAYNVFNSSAVLGENSTYGATWRTPTAILAARLIKFGVQIDWR